MQERVTLMFRTPHLMLLHLNISSSSNKHTGNSPTCATVAVNTVPGLGEDPRRPIKVSISPLSRCALDPSILMQPASFLFNTHMYMSSLSIPMPPVEDTHLTGDRCQ